jgi:RNA methyltransferase, TrmH family
MKNTRISQKITSFSNPKVKYIQSLKDRKSRDKEERIFLEGYREITRAFLQSKKPNPLLPKFEPEILCISPDCFLGSNEWDLIDSINVPIWEFPRSVFEKMSHRDRPDGLIAIAKLPDYIFQPKLLERIEDGIILVIEGVEKPGNLGTIIRTAEGAGVRMILVTDPRTDIYSPNVIRSSTGILFHLPVYVGETEYILNSLAEAGFKRFALTPEAKVSYTQINLTGKVALVFGSEQYGLTDKAKSISDDNLMIPMKGEADSLNLALSAGIVVYESLRQRNINP